jgi:folate-binding protein YgfZ
LGGKKVTVLGTTPLGRLGYDLIVRAEDAVAVWDFLVHTGATPIGEATVEWLRVSAGWPQYGAEATEAYNPLEAGLRGAVSFTNVCYIGQEVVALLDAYKKVQRALVRLTLTSKVEPGAPLLVHGQRVGEITSVAQAPDGTWVALGYVRGGNTVEKAALDAGNGVVARVAGVALPYGMEKD